MRRYMIQIKYNVQSVKGLVATPQDHFPQAGEIIRTLGGRLVDFYFTLGEWDAVIIFELESGAHAMGVAMADVVGDVGVTKVTILYCMDEAVAAMTIVKSIDYSAPGLN